MAVYYFTTAGVYIFNEKQQCYLEISNKSCEAANFGSQVTECHNILYEKGIFNITVKFAGYYRPLYFAICTQTVGTRNLCYLSACG